MKVYTKTGDGGFTSVIGEKRSKSDIRIESYGSVDEALAVIGDALNLSKLPIKTREEMHIIIDRLFDLNRALATVEFTNYIKESDIKFLEDSIDYMQTKLSPLESFILPIGDCIYTKLNIIRTLVRKAERNVVALANIETINPLLIQYLNRLSDYFFVAARYSNYCNNKCEIIKHFDM